MLSITQPFEDGTCFLVRLRPDKFPRHITTAPIVHRINAGSDKKYSQNQNIVLGGVTAPKAPPTNSVMTTLPPKESRRTKNVHMTKPFFMFIVILF
jgi:hypothetical protein